MNISALVSCLFVLEMTIVVIISLAMYGIWFEVYMVLLVSRPLFLLVVGEDVVTYLGFQYLVCVDFTFFWELVMCLGK